MKTEWQEIVEKLEIPTETLNMLPAIDLLLSNEFLLDNNVSAIAVGESLSFFSSCNSSTNPLTSWSSHNNEWVDGLDGDVTMIGVTESRLGGTIDGVCRTVEYRATPQNVWSVFKHYKKTHHYKYTTTFVVAPSKEQADRINRLFDELRGMAVDDADQE